MEPTKKINLEELRKGGIVKLKEKDMFSVWVRTVCNNLDAKKLIRVANIADNYGRGFILFSTRKIPIIPFIHINDIQRVKEELNSVNMMLDRCGSRVRNADVCYDKNLCEYAVINPIELGEKLDKIWKDDKGGFKIKMSIVGCEKQCTSPRTLSDIGFVGVKKNDKIGYDVYFGGRLGLNPNIGTRIADCISEDQCVKLAQNYIDFVKENGRPGERAASILQRVGYDYIKGILNDDLDNCEIQKYICETKLNQKDEGIIIKICATCGEVTSSQVRKIAQIAERYGKGFVHFSIYGSPELPGISKSDLPKILLELNQVGLKIIDDGIDNLQTCFGDYCVNGIVDTSSLLKEIEQIIKELNINMPRLRISASGCPNSCGVSHMSDIGFMGVVEVDVNHGICDGCGLCLRGCKKKAITIIDKKAIIDKQKCAFCGECMRICPYNAIYEVRRGHAILLGGAIGGKTKLGKTYFMFLTEEEALEITRILLEEIKRKNKTIAEMIEECSEIIFDKDNGF